MRTMLGVVIAVALAIAACGPSPEEEAAEDAARVEEAREALEAMVATVLYEVEGTDIYGEPYGPNNPGNFDLTMETPDGTTQASPDLPLHLESAGPKHPGVEYVFSTGDFLYLSAQAKMSGSITCRITVDGEVISEVTSQGQYSIAQCDGTAE